MTTKTAENLQFTFDQVTKTAMIVQGQRMATVPGRVTSQSEAERLGWSEAEP